MKKESRIKKWGKRIIWSGLGVGLLAGSCFFGEQNFGVVQGYLGKKVEESQQDCSGLKKYICRLELPKPEEKLEKFYEEGQGGEVVVFSRKGEGVKRFRNLSKKIDYGEISEKVIKAWKAAEDKRFDYHHGWDLGSLAVAVKGNIKSKFWKKGFVRGASTTTHNLADILLNGKDKAGEREREQSGREERIKEKIKGKIKEWVYAPLIERRFSKEEILTHFLNLAYFGRGAYGIESAAESYFGKKAKELDWLESIMLVAMVKKPTVYGGKAYEEAIREKDCFEENLGEKSEKCREKTKNFQGLVRRSGYVLEKLTEMNWINREDYYKAKERLNYGEISFQEKEKKFLAGDEYTNKVLEKINWQESRERLAGNLKIYTYLDKELQEFVRENFKEELLKIRGEAKFPHPEELNGAVIVADLERGGVLAMVGGLGKGEEDYLERATRVYSPAGSAFKPFVLAAALEKGLMMSDTFLDAPRKFEVGGKIYQPSNFREEWSYKEVSLFEGLVGSKNIIFVKLNEELQEAYGKEAVKNWVERIGLKMNCTDLSSALGANEMSLWELVGGYRVLATGFTERAGREEANLSLIERVEYKGKTMEEERRRERMMGEETRKEIDRGLREVVRQGTGKKAEIEGYDLRCKTGTGRTSFGIICYEPALGYLTGVYFASDEPAKTGDFEAYSPYTGGNYPALLTKKIFEYLIEKRY